MEGKPRASVPEPQMVVVEGRTATLRCHAHGNAGPPDRGCNLLRCHGDVHAASENGCAGSPAPVISWSKLRSPLPWRHQVVNNSLVLPNVGRQDSGEYICRASNSMGTSQVTIKLDVESECWEGGVPRASSPPPPRSGSDQPGQN